MYEFVIGRDKLLEKIEDLVTRKRYAELRGLLLPLEAPDIADIFESVNNAEIPLVFRLLPKELAAEVFVELDSDQQELLILSFSNTELKEVLDELYLDDAVDIVEEMPAGMVKRILRHSDPEMRKSINEILKYPEDSTGSIMTTEFVDLKETMTVADALKRIRRTGPDKETINISYVIDEERHLLGLVTIRTAGEIRADIRLVPVVPPGPHLIERIGPGRCGLGFQSLRLKGGGHLCPDHPHQVLPQAHLPNLLPVQDLQDRGLIPRSWNEGFRRFLRL